MKIEVNDLSLEFWVYGNTIKEASDGRGCNFKKSQNYASSMERICSIISGGYKDIGEIDGWGVFKDRKKELCIFDSFTLNDEFYLLSARYFLINQGDEKSADIKKITNHFQEKSLAFQYKNSKIIRPQVNDKIIDIKLSKEKAHEKFTEFTNKHHDNPAV